MPTASPNPIIKAMRKIVPSMSGSGGSGSPSLNTYKNPPINRASNIVFAEPTDIKLVEINKKVDITAKLKIIFLFIFKHQSFFIRYE